MWVLDLNSSSLIYLTFIIFPSFSFPISNMRLILPSSQMI